MKPIYFFPLLASYKNESEFSVDVLFIRDGVGVVVDTQDGKYDTPYKIGYTSTGFNSLVDTDTWIVIEDNEEVVKSLALDHIEHAQRFINDNPIKDIESLVKRGVMIERQKVLHDSIEFIKKGFGV